MQVVRQINLLPELLGGGIAEAVFVGDVEQLGTFGDLIGGPTEIDRATDGDPVQENY